MERQDRVTPPWMGRMVMKVRIRNRRANADIMSAEDCVSRRRYVFLYTV